MALSKLGGIWLDLKLMLRRTGIARLLAGGFALTAGMMYFIATPWLAQKAEALKKNYAALSHSPALNVRQSLQQDRHQAFLDRLPTLRERPTVLKALFEASASSGVVLSQAEYQLQRTDPGGYVRLRMSLPVTAPYPKVRTFLAAFLEQVPSGSIDEIALRRETVNNPVISANLKLSIYFKEID